MRIGMPIVFIFFFIMMVLGVGIKRYVRLFMQIQDLKNWPVDTACPMLWKDLRADFIWPLA
jgi:hypothetical protein